MKKKILCLFVGLLFLAVGASGCTGDDEDAQTAANTAAAQQVIYGQVSSIEGGNFTLALMEGGAALQLQEAAAPGALIPSGESQTLRMPEDGQLYCLSGQEAVGADFLTLEPGDVVRVTLTSDQLSSVLILSQGE
ncbi:hypothetical protein [Luoshenia tenuis]|uniref:hypothetical protein n=1 Tax=Luoshenia tenuis TaxID=2763654 RepID=UPI003D912D9E